MGNNFSKIFKKEDDEISDIRHYIEYLNQEKKRNFEPLPDSKKAQKSLTKPALFCDLSNCANLLTFNKKTVIFYIFCDFCFHSNLFDFRLIGKKISMKNANVYQDHLNGAR